MKESKASPASDLETAAAATLGSASEAAAKPQQQQRRRRQRQQQQQQQQAAGSSNSKQQQQQQQQQQAEGPNRSRAAQEDGETSYTITVTAAMPQERGVNMGARWLAFALARVVVIDTTSNSSSQLAEDTAAAAAFCYCFWCQWPPAIATPGHCMGRCHRVAMDNSDVFVIRD